MSTEFFNMGMVFSKLIEYEVFLKHMTSGIMHEAVFQAFLNYKKRKAAV
jgi:hypothetical protein